VHLAERLVQDTKDLQELEVVLAEVQLHVQLHAQLHEVQLLPLLHQAPRLQQLSVRSCAIVQEDLVQLEEVEDFAREIQSVENSLFYAFEQDLLSL